MAVGSSIPERVLMEASNRQARHTVPCVVKKLFGRVPRLSGCFAFWHLTSVVQGMQTSHVRKALQVMLNRGQLVVRAQGNLLTRAR